MNNKVFFVLMITIVCSSVLCWTVDEPFYLNKKDIKEIRKYHVAFQNVCARASDCRAHGGGSCLCKVPVFIQQAYFAAHDKESSILYGALAYLIPSKKMFVEEGCPFMLDECLRSRRYFLKFKNPDGSVVTRMHISDSAGFEREIHKSEKQVKTLRLIWHGSSKLKK